MYGSTARAILAGGGINAVYFDGSNDYLTRGADLTGISDGKSGTISFWFKAVDVGSSVFLLRTSNGRFGIELKSTDKIEVVGDRSTGANALTMSTSTTITYNTWNHFIASWDLSTAATHIYVNDSSNKTTSLANNFDIDYAGSGNIAIAAQSTGATKYNGDLAEFWFDTSYIDISSSSNRRKFISATGKPVVLGATGNLPTGSSPLLFLSGNAASFATNKGTGGGMTVNGTLTNSTTSPSD